MEKQNIRRLCRIVVGLDVDMVLGGHCRSIQRRSWWSPFPCDETLAGQAHWVWTWWIICSGLWIHQNTTEHLLGIWDWTVRRQSSKHQMREHPEICWIDGEARRRRSCHALWWLTLTSGGIHIHLSNKMWLGAAPCEKPTHHVEARSAASYWVSNRAVSYLLIYSKATSTWYNSADEGGMSITHA